MPTHRIGRASVQQSLLSVAIVLAGAFTMSLAHADEVFSRQGLDPSQQSKVTRVLARERIQRVSGGETPAAASSATPGVGRKECKTDIGNVDNSNARPGQRPPKDNIVVIKAPVVNNCR